MCGGPHDASSTARDAMPRSQNCCHSPPTKPRAASRASLCHDLRDSLERVYRVQFTILDGESGDVLSVSPKELRRDWAMCAELCREVARRGSPEFIEDEDPLLTLALPLCDERGSSRVAIVSFLTRRIEPGEDLSRQAALLGVRVEEIRAWADSQTPWKAGALGRLQGNEAGSVEVSVLESLAAILSLRSGNRDSHWQRSDLLPGLVQALTSAIDAKDPCLCRHSDRVARIAVRLAQELGGGGAMLDTLYLAGLLHDVGKIGVDDDVLCKAGTLSTDEYEHIKQHVEIGHRILHDLAKLEDILPVVLYHHEAWDGGGYPHGLGFDQIPLGARIVAVADAFDAMSSDRPYRRRLPDTRVKEILRAGGSAMGSRGD